MLKKTIFLLNFMEFNKSLLIKFIIFLFLLYYLVFGKPISLEMFVYFLISAILFSFVSFIVVKIIVNLIYNIFGRSINKFLSNILPF